MLKKRMFKLICAVMVLMLSLTVMLTNARPASAASGTVNVLMIGNSLTYRRDNSTIRCLKKLGSKSGYNIKVTYIAYGNECLRTYANNRTRRGKEVRRAIRKKNWDYIILQENTNYSVAQGATMKKAVISLGKYIHKYKPKAKIFLNSTWAYDKTKTLWRKRFRFSEQQKLINKNTQAAAKKIGAKVICSGSAFEYYKATYHNYDLYQKDKNHPSEAGGYLNACCIYAAILNRSPYGISFCDGLGKKNALHLQECAAKFN